MPTVSARKRRTALPAEHALRHLLCSTRPPPPFSSHRDCRNTRRSRSTMTVPLATARRQGRDADPPTRRGSGRCRGSSMAFETKVRWTSRRPIIWSVLGCLFVATLAVSYFVVESAVQNTVELQALSVAQIVATQATTARSVYSQEIAAKLQRDGKGPDVDFAQMPGHVPIPSQFLKLLGRASSATSAGPVPVQAGQPVEPRGVAGAVRRLPAVGLAAARAAGRGEAERPDRLEADLAIRRRERFGSAPAVLRYLYADPASQQSCVACHNAYEARPDIQARRTGDGTALGRTWQQHQLMGALSITIPLDRIQTAAGTQIRRTSLYVFGLLVPVFLVIVGFNLRITRKDRALRLAEQQLRATEVKAETTRIQLLANEGVQKAFSELSTYLQAIDQHSARVRARSRRPRAACERPLLRDLRPRRARDRERASSAGRRLRARRRLQERGVGRAAGRRHLEGRGLLPQHVGLAALAGHGDRADEGRAGTHRSLHRDPDRLHGTQARRGAHQRARVLRPAHRAAEPDAGCSTGCRRR